MITQITMPWWGWGYLLFVMTMFISSLFTEKKLSTHEIIGSALSLFTICVFVTGFFNVFVSHFLGVMLLPMLAVGVYWEFSQAVLETSRAQGLLKDQNDLSDGERDFLLNMAIAFNGLVVVPGYVMGLVLCAEMIGALMHA